MRWVRESLPGLADLNPVNTAWAAAPADGGEVWLGGEGLARWDGHALTRVRLPWRSPWVTGLWGSSSRDLWAVGAGVAHFDGKRWRALKVPKRARRDVPETAYGAVWGSGANDVWVASDLGELLHFDGQHWRRDRSDSPHALRALWGAAPNDVWAGGDYGALIHFDGAAWRKQEVPAGTINVIWGSGPRDIWAAGGAHWLIHYNGESWSRVDAPVAGCTALLGGGPASRAPRFDDVWLGCAAGILHYSPHAEDPLEPGKAP